jgi:hypothetical protein
LMHLADGVVYVIDCADAVANHIDKFACLICRGLTLRLM